MIFQKTDLDGVYLIIPEPKGDQRGWFARTYCEREFDQIGFKGRWVQCNQSYTKSKGTIRGMHFQKEPHGEVKLIRCIHGKVFDVIVDLRIDSPSYKNWIGIELSKENQYMLFVPEGCAHGFQTLADDTELIYHMSYPYTPIAESGVRYNDPKLNIQWPLPVSEVSQRDMDFNLL